MLKIRHYTEKRMDIREEFEINYENGLSVHIGRPLGINTKYSPKTGLYFFWLAL